jgi:cell division septum initiation protein DivIVA
MAGENGKGFGAVAADIRRLAERAKELSTSVGRIVRSVRDDIGAVAIAMNDTERETSAGSKLAEEAGTSLESIVAVIERQADEIEGINQMALQQQQSSGEVVQMMQNVSETTQENTGSTREAALNMERVARLAEQLLASVEAFKLRDDMNYLEFADSAFGNNAVDQPTPAGSFRTVTATAQPLSGGNLYETPIPPSDGFFPQFPQFAAAPYQQGNGSGPLTQPPAGQNGKPGTFPPAGSPVTRPQGQGGFGSGQLAFLPANNGNSSQPAPNYNGGQMPFPSPGSDQPFPAWNNEQTYQGFPPQSPAPYGSQPQQGPASADWQQSGNWNQADWQA